MIKVLAFLVIGFFAVLWVTGNNPASLKHQMVHWADADPSMTGGGREGWGN